MSEVTVDFTVRVADCLGFCAEKGDFVPVIDLKNEDTSRGLKRRIIAVTEGTHNGIQFRANEIEAMIQRAIELKEHEKRKYFKVPLVLDHSDSFLDKVGATYNLEFGKDPEKGLQAAIADVEFWNTTPMLREVAERVKLDPENTFFSVRVRGRIEQDAEGEYLADMTLIHIAVVNEPADPNARLISNSKEEAKMEESFDFGVVPSNPSNYRKASEDTSWEKPRLEDFTSKRWDELSDAEKRRIAQHFAWAPKMPPNAFTDLKLPHHRPSDGAVVWNGVRAAMATLMGARGGVDIPAADKRKVYSHLAAHYREFEKEPPEANFAKSDFALNTEGSELNNKGGLSMEEIEKIKADLKKEYEQKLEEVKQEFAAKVNELEELTELRAEIIAIYPEVDRDFLKSLNREQLEKYKADLEKRMVETQSTEKSRDNAAKAEDPFELAEKYFGPVEEVV